jgi:hypothetical protein
MLYLREEVLNFILVNNILQGVTEELHTKCKAFPAVLKLFSHVTHLAEYVGEQVTIPECTESSRGVISNIMMLEALIIKQVADKAKHMPSNRKINDMIFSVSNYLADDLVTAGFYQAAARAAADVRQFVDELKDCSQEHFGGSQQCSL